MRITEAGMDNVTLGVDFGVSNTVVAVREGNPRRSRAIPLPGRSRNIRAGAGDEQVPVIPSLIHYSPDGHRWTGQEVMERGLPESPGTVSRMKHYISSRSSARIVLSGSTRSYREAGSDFLVEILSSLSGENPRRIETVFAVPPEADGHYREWILSAAGAIGMSHVRVVDEASAAALGYRLPLRPGEVFMLFGLGGGSLEVCVVRVEEDGAGIRCRVLGSARDALGGMYMDRWIAAGVGELAEHQGTGTGSSLPDLLRSCRMAREDLTFLERTEIRAGEGPAYPFTRSCLEKILEGHGFFSRLHSTIQQALQTAGSRGYTEEDLAGVLMTGGCSLIPSIKAAVEERFGRSRTHSKYPLDAVARGASEFFPEDDNDFQLKHDYALRFWNSGKMNYEFRTIARRGQRCPSSRPVSRFLIRGTYEGQTQLGIPVYELPGAEQGNQYRSRELVSDPEGGVRLVESRDESDQRAAFWVNERDPFFLTADPPTLPGESRFELSFSLDGNKQLLVSARDLKTGRIAVENRPVIRLD